ncbi:MAG: SCO family protein [Bacteroidetes bacterium]|nr:SCO family protein [Bacteroidota bacterium]
MATDKKVNKMLWGILVVALVGIGIFALSDWMRHQEKDQPTRVLPAYGAVPDFTLTNQDNAPVSLKDLKGKIWLVDLIFTNCAGTCPMLTARMAAIQSAISKTPPDVQLVSISVDPNNDTPPVLKDYAKKYSADPKRWTFLTGKVATIYSMAKDGFHLTLDSAHEDVHEPIVHSERLVLVDRTGNIRGYYNGTEEDAQSKVLADLGELLREGKKD